MPWRAKASSMARSVATTPASRVCAIALVPDWSPVPDGLGGRLSIARRRLSAVDSRSVTISAAVNLTASARSRSARRRRFSCSARAYRSWSRNVAISCRNRSGCSAAPPSGPPSSASRSLGGSETFAPASAFSPVTGVQAGGSLAGNDSRDASSTRSSASGGNVEPAARLVICGLSMSWLGALRRHPRDRYLLPAAQPEGQRQERAAEQQGVGRDPPDQDHRPGQRPDDQQNTPDQGSRTGEEQ